MLKRLDLGRRARAAGWHLLISAVVAALAAALVFGLWYPGAYRHLSGGRGLFILVVTVDVILGPLLTFAVFNLNKGWPHLRRDLAIIGVIQLAGLAYGLHTVYVVRPVATVFETDRFRVVTASDVYLPELPQAPEQYRSLPLDGPRLLSTRRPSPGEERNEALMMALKQGVDVGQRPLFWRPYDEGRAAALQRARPIEVLLRQYEARAAEFRAALTDAGLPEAEAFFLPVMARGDWVAVLDKQGNVATFLAADGFF
ncbi:MAG: TfpX/TfpZ family type IV pilin accessory protein [Piscinibacter sp.]